MRSLIGNYYTTGSLKWRFKIFPDYLCHRTGRFAAENDSLLRSQKSRYLHDILL